MFAYGPSDLDPTIRTYPDLDLISHVNFGSGGSGIWARGAAALLAGAELRGGASPEEAIPAFPWPIWAAVGSNSIGGIRVTHLCTQVGGLGLGRGSRRCRAALRGGARRRAVSGHRSGPRA